MLFHPMMLRTGIFREVFWRGFWSYEDAAS